MQWKLRVYGAPVGQPRAAPRVAKVGDRIMAMSGAVPKGHAVHVFKAQLRAEAAELFAAPLDIPIGVSIVAVFPRTQGEIWKKRPMPRAYHTKRPDGDNVTKAVLDALNKVAWRDDSLIAEMRIVKFIAAGDEQPHTEVVVFSL